MVEEEKESLSWLSLSEQAGHLIDNILKGFFDALVSEDKYIANITATKRWVDYPSGWIECTVQDEPEFVPIQPPVKE